MRTKVRPGVITKLVRLVSGQRALYCSHEIQGIDGPMCLGHHAMLQFPDREGAGRIACSGFRFGRVRPARFENSGHGGYSSLQQGAFFRDLRRVLGIEDITAFFDFGFSDSARPNPLSRRGVPTTLMLRHSCALRIPYVMGVTAIPRGFETVRRVRFGLDYVVFISNSGATVRQPVNLSFFSP